MKYLACILPIILILFYIIFYNNISEPRINEPIYNASFFTKPGTVFTKTEFINTFPITIHPDFLTCDSNDTPKFCSLEEQRYHNVLKKLVEKYKKTIADFKKNYPNATKDEFNVFIIRSCPFLYNKYEAAIQIFLDKFTEPDLERILLKIKQSHELFIRESSIKEFINKNYIKLIKSGSRLFENIINKMFRHYNLVHRTIHDTLSQDSSNEESLTKRILNCMKIAKQFLIGELKKNRKEVQDVYRVYPITIYKSITNKPDSNLFSIYIILVYILFSILISLFL